MSKARPKGPNSPQEQLFQKVLVPFASGQSWPSLLSMNTLNIWVPLEPLETERIPNSQKWHIWEYTTAITRVKQHHWIVQKLLKLGLKDGQFHTEIKGKLGGELSLQCKGLLSGIVDFKLDFSASSINYHVATSNPKN